MPIRAPRDSEWATRKLLIDKRLRAAGWRVTPFAAGKPLSAMDKCAIEEYPTANGPADYALVVDGQILGVVEAKKLSVGPNNVLTQAARYASGIVQSELSFGSHGVPFLYATNGEVLRFHDVRHDLNVSRDVAGFHTPNALLEFLGRDLEAGIAALGSLPNDSERLRP